MKHRSKPSCRMKRMLRMRWISFKCHAGLEVARPREIERQYVQTNDTSRTAFDG